MEVLRKYTDRDCRERQTALNGTICFSEQIDFLDEKIAGAVGKRYRKEERATIKLALRYWGMKLSANSRWARRYAPIARRRRA
jgi:uncharacterized protein YecT (DUF1311 family)